MKKTIYYRQHIRRQSQFTDFFFQLFLALSSYPRMLLEVFIRRNFGERYLRLVKVIIFSIFMFLLPTIITGLLDRGSLDNDKAWAGWYIFMFVFLVVSFIHTTSHRSQAALFDFSKYSLYSGDRLLYKLGIKTSPRNLETIVEPLAFFILGLIIWATGQTLGVLLIVCSVIYSLGYVAAYDYGDNFILDKIDEMICNKFLEKSFVDDAPVEETDGFRVVSSRPESADLRRQVLPFLSGEDDAVEAR